MEFVRVKQFTNAELSVKKSKFKDEALISISSYCYSEEDQILTVGLSNGRILQFKKKGFDSKHFLATKEYETVNFNEVQGAHKGDIKCLCYERIKGQTYLITGSTDRNIKIWESDPKAKSVVQTLVGHNGTIQALKYARTSDTLFSASNDKTLKIWKQEDGREFLFHPWYVVFQVIYDFSMRKMINYQAYLTCALVRESETLTVFAGDTEGSLHIIKQEEAWKSTSTFLIEKSYFNFHRLHVIQIMSIDKDNTLFSIGYDQKILGFEESAGKQFFSYKNPHKCLFTSIDWNPLHSELLASDESGRIYFINVQTDKQVQEYKLYDRPIKHLKLIESTQQLLIVTDGAIDVLRMKRGIKTGNLADLHKGPIIGLVTIELPQLKKQNQPPRLVSASLDNTIRVWDPQDMTCNNLLENGERSEISSIHYLKQANLLVTGHDNGHVKLWNADLGSSLLVQQNNPAMRHTNMVCCLASHVFTMNSQGGGESNEFLFSAGYDGKINIWEIFEKRSSSMSSSSANIVPQLKHSVMGNKTPNNSATIGDELLCLLFDGATNCIVAAGNQKEIYFIEMFTYEHRIIFKGHKDSINCLTMDGNILFSGSDDKTIRLWDTVNCQYLTCIEAHEKGVRDLLVIEESGHLVSCSEGVIHVWDYPNKKLVTKFSKPDNFRCLAYVVEDLCLFVGTEENNIYNYPMKDIIEQSKIDKSDYAAQQSPVAPQHAKRSKKLQVVDDNDHNSIKIEQLASNDFLAQLQQHNKEILQGLMQ